MNRPAASFRIAIPSPRTPRALDVDSERSPAMLALRVAALLMPLAILVGLLCRAPAAAAVAFAGALLVSFVARTRRAAFAAGLLAFAVAATILTWPAALLTLETLADWALAPLA